MGNGKVSLIINRKMIFRTQVKSKKIEVSLITFEDLRENHSKELVDFFMQSVHIAQE